MEHLVDAIRCAGGQLSFERFMEIALYAPGLGYYSAGARKLGAAGDFVTAPEVSALFGGCVARQCAEVLGALAGGDLLEIGPGSGRLAVDVLRELERLGRLPRRYLLLETSADLRERQAGLLAEQVPQHLDRTIWLDAPPREPFEGLVLANEVLDALPVRCFRVDAGRVRERVVASRNGALCWETREADATLAAACARLQPTSGWPSAYESEYCPRLAAWTAAMTASLVRGLVLWIDYGLPRAAYYAPARIGGTLIAHFRQRVLDEPLCRPGLQDLSAWVDFTAVAEAAQGAGFELAGYTSQTYFLAALGIDQLMVGGAGADARRRAQLSGEARRLLMPGEMGERFKVMGWSRGLDLEPRGFSLRDSRHEL